MLRGEYFLTDNSLENARDALASWNQYPDFTIWTTGVGTYVVAEEGWSPPAKAYQISPEEIEKLLKESV